MDRKNSSLEPKVQAKALRKYLAEQGLELGHGKCLEAVSRMYGHKDWNTFAASREETVPPEKGEASTLPQELNDLEVAALCIEAFRPQGPFNRLLTWVMGDPATRVDPVLRMGGMFGLRMRQDLKKEKRRLMVEDPKVRQGRSRDERSDIADLLLEDQYTNLDEFEQRMRILENLKVTAASKPLVAYTDVLEWVLAMRTYADTHPHLYWVLSDTNPYIGCVAFDRDNPDPSHVRTFTVTTGAVRRSSETVNEEFYVLLHAYTMTLSGRAKIAEDLNDPEHPIITELLKKAPKVG